MLAVRKLNHQVNCSRRIKMPDYLIKIGNNKNRGIKKLKIFSSCAGDAEVEAKKTLKRGERLLSVSNNSFPFGHYKAVNNPR